MTPSVSADAVMSLHANTRLTQSRSEWRDEELHEMQQRSCQETLYK